MPPVNSAGFCFRTAAAFRRRKLKLRTGIIIRSIPGAAAVHREDAFQGARFFEPVGVGTGFTPAPGLRGRFHAAGTHPRFGMLHLASARTSVLFSGDIGRPNDSLMRPPADPPASDYLVVESTYGARRHDAADPHVQFGDTSAARPIEAV